MSASTAIIPQGIEDNATFRAWATATHALILTAGWVQTADTGQIDLITATLPSTDGYAGYEIFRRDDALQAAAPIFCKVEYGQGVTSLRVALRLTFGAGSDGAGAITQPSAVRSLLASQTPSAGETRPGYACDFVGGGAVVEMCANSTSSISFAVERWRDTDGTPNADGWSYIAAADAVFEGEYRVASVAWRERNSFTCFVPSTSSASLGGDVSVFPHLPIFGTAKPPGLMFVAYLAADISSAASIVVARYGVPRTYMPLGNASSDWGSGFAYMAPAVIYD